MLKTNLSRLLIGAALAAGAAALHAGEASADRRIQIGAGGNPSACSSGGSTLVAEAIGMDIFNNTVCQAWSLGGTATAQCPFGVIKHRARIIKRSNTLGQLILPIVQQSPEQPNWTATSSSITQDIPAGPGCTGTFVTAVSLGKEVP